MKILHYLFFILSIYPLCSCEKKCYYLSESAKEYLFYNQGDTIVFTNQSDTLYGYVFNKKFWTTTAGLFESTSYEVGQVKIGILNKVDNATVLLEAVNMGVQTEINYKFHIPDLNQRVDSCMADFFTFSAFLIRGELYSNSLDSPKYLKLHPIGTNIYELFYKNEYCNYQQCKLKIDKTEGLTLLVLNESDSLSIRRYKE